MKTVSCAVKSFFIENVAGFGMIVGNNGEYADVPEDKIQDFVDRGLIKAPKGFEQGADAADDSTITALPILAGLNKARLLEIAALETVDVEDGATNKEIIAAIEAKRAADVQAQADAVAQSQADAADEAAAHAAQTGTDGSGDGEMAPA